MKPKFAFTWTAGCGGCEASLLDLGPELVEWNDRIDMVYWPVALDYKMEQLDKLADGELQAAWINGAIRTEAQTDLVLRLRRKARLIVAHGTCAHLGGVVGLANRFGPEALLAPEWRTVRGWEPRLTGLPEGDEEGKKGTPPLPALVPRVLPLDRVIPVDYIVPGCPPPPQLNARALAVLVDGPLPSPGRVLAGDKALCHDCPRRETLPEKIRWTRPLRVHQTLWDPARCFLAESLPCLGPVTRSGCDSRCLRANMPCRGCFGPLDRVEDQGAKTVALLASLLETREEMELEGILEDFADPLGLTYLFSLAASLLYGKRVENSHVQNH